MKNKTMISLAKTLAKGAAQEVFEKNIRLSL